MKLKNVLKLSSTTASTASVLRSRLKVVQNVVLMYLPLHQLLYCGTAILDVSALQAVDI